VRSGDALAVGAVVATAAVVYWATRRRAPAVQRNFEPRTPHAEDEQTDAYVVRNRPADRVAELLARYLSRTPKTESLYPVQPGDDLRKIAASALRAVGPCTAEQIDDYALGIAGVPYNLMLYGTPSTSKSYSASLLVPGLQQGIRVAFLARNDDAVAAMSAGRMPVRTVDPVTGAALGTGEFMGTLWLPPVCPHALSGGVVTCAPFEWPDGSSRYNPDPQLLGRLRGPVG